MQPHPSLGSPFAKPQGWELEALSLSNVHPKPQPHPRSRLLAEPSQHWQPHLKGKNLSKEIFCDLPPSLSSTRRGLGLSESPMEALQCPKSIQRSSGAPKGTWRALGHTERQTNACQDTESQTDGIWTDEKPGQGAGRARKGTLRLLGSLDGRWGVLEAPKGPRRALEQTERHAEAPGLHRKANGGSWSALKGPWRNAVCPEMHTGASRMH